jgi:hypothetical protein
LKRFLGRIEEDRQASIVTDTLQTATGRAETAAKGGIHGVGAERTDVKLQTEQPSPGEFPSASIIRSG